MAEHDRLTPAAVGIGAYGKDDSNLTSRAATNLLTRGIPENLILAIDGGRVIAKDFALPRWSLRPIVAVTTGSLRVLNRAGSEELLALPVHEIGWVRSRLDGVLIEISRDRSLRLVTGAINRDRLVSALRAAVTQAAGGLRADAAVRVSEQRVVIAEGRYCTGRGTGLAPDVAVLAIDGRCVSAMTPQGRWYRALGTLTSLDIHGDRAATLRVAFSDSDATFDIESHSPDRLRAELQPLVAWRSTGPMPRVPVSLLKGRPSPKDESVPEVGREAARPCSMCGTRAAAGDPSCGGCGAWLWIKRPAVDSVTLTATSLDHGHRSKGRGMGKGAELRPDILAAKNRLQWTLGSGREIKKLVTYLDEGERVDAMVGGQYGKGQGLLTLTDRRLLFIIDGITTKTSEDFPLSKVSSVGWNGGMLTGTITIFASGNKAEIKNVDKDNGKEFVDLVRPRLADGPRQSAPPPPAAVHRPGPVIDVADQLMKLAMLRDQGILTEEEFAAQKAKLLSM